MTVESTTTPRWNYTGDGVTKAFAYETKIYESSDLEVYLDGALQASGYTVSGVLDDDGGAVTFTTAPASAVAVVIVKNIPPKQTADYEEGDAFPSAVHELALDRAILVLQQILDLVQNRTLAMADTDPAASLARLPAKTALASKYLGFDGDGQPAALGAPTDTALTTSFAETLLDDADAAAARSTLAAAGTGDANTFTETQTVQSADAGAGVGPRIVTHRNSASPAASDLIGAYDFDGEDDGGNQTTYARLQGKISDPTDASEDGALHYYKTVAGTLTDQGEVRAGAIAASELPAGSIVQVVSVQDGAVATGSTNMPTDDTIPQNTEGDEYMTLAITPTDASNILQIDVVFIGAISGTVRDIDVALFQDATAGALAAAAGFCDAASALITVSFRHRMTAGTASETTFKVRAGVDGSSTLTFNGKAGGRIFGGVMASSITITEIAA